MGLFDLFGKKTKEELPEETGETKLLEDTEAFSGMRVEVTTFDDELLFAAKLMDFKKDTAELYQYSETGMPQGGEPLPVRIRGYSAFKRKAVYMEGVITPEMRQMWRVEDLVIKKVENDRAFFRLNMDADAILAVLDEPDAAGKVCKLLNISIGGAYIFSEEEYCLESRFLLRFKLLEGGHEFALPCEVLRIIDKDGKGYEYGCRFLEISEADQQKITQSMFAIQSKRKDIC